MARAKTASRTKGKKQNEQFDVAAWVDGCPVTSKCQTCSHPIAHDLLNKALAHMAENGKHHVTRDQLHSMLVKMSSDGGVPYTTKATAFHNHLKRCVPVLWDQAKGKHG